jgi:CRP/FNR family transcriptional activator FtrB
LCPPARFRSARRTQPGALDAVFHVPAAARAVSQITRLKQNSTAQRLAGFLLGLTEASSSPAVVRTYDKRLAAESLGMTAESLSRSLARLGELGVESRADNAVAIRDVAALRTFSAAEAE